MGQKLYRQFPYLLAALLGLDRRLPMMSDFHKKAIEVAGIFGECRGIQTHPATPHTNTFIVQFSKGNGKYMEARDRVALETGLWLFDYMPKIEPESGAFEVHIWEGGVRCSLES